MIGVVATIKVKPGMEKEFEAVAKELVAKVNANEPHRALGQGGGADQAAVDAHRGTEYFKALGRKMGEYMDGRAEVMRLREVV